MAGVTAERAREELKETIKAEAEKQTEVARKELGEVVLETTDKYFPEAVKRRRRRDMASGFALGAVVGFLIRYAIGEP